MSVVPENTSVIRSDENIDSTDASRGQLFLATVREDVPDASGGIAIPRGTPAKLVLRNATGGGATHSQEPVLDLFCGERGRKGISGCSSDADMSSNRGVEKINAPWSTVREARDLGPSWAGIGAAAGAGAGRFTQLLTRGKQVKVPADGDALPLGPDLCAKASIWLLARIL